MTLDNSTLYCMCERREACDCLTLGTPGKTAATVFEVLCRAWPVAGTAFYDVTSCDAA